jgi:hypothetical protein
LTFFIWAYFMKVIPETCRTHWVRYICIYWKYTTILYVVDIIVYWSLRIRLGIKPCGQISHIRCFAYARTIFILNNSVSDETERVRRVKNFYNIWLFLFGRTLWKLSQRRIARTELDIYVFIGNIRQYCMS